MRAAEQAARQVAGRRSAYMSRPMLPHSLIASPANAGRAALPTAVRSEIDEPIGAKSIEVAALLGDSIVDVKHCIDPRSGKVTRTTIAWLVIAAVMFVTCAVAFAVSV